VFSSRLSRNSSWTFRGAQAIQAALDFVARFVEVERIVVNNARVPFTIFMRSLSFVIDSPTAASKLREDRMKLFQPIRFPGFDFRYQIKEVLPSMLKKLLGLFDSVGQGTLLLGGKFRVHW
jgi:hypothetical protein